MYDAEKIRSAFERKARALKRMPSVGQGTAVTHVHVREDYTCDIEDGPWRLVADQSKKSGGNQAGPDPGVLIRAALGTCLAMGYIRWAAQLGVSLKSVSVEIHADYDARGQYGVGDTPPGYTAVRYRVLVETDAAEADVLRVLDAADAHSPYFDVFTRPVSLQREVCLTSTVA